MTKSELRKQIKTSFLEHSSYELKTESKRICSEIISSHIFKQSSLILCYMNLEDEVDLSLVLNECFKFNKRVALPYIYKGTSKMDFFEIENAGNVEKGSFNIKEPSPSSAALISSKDFIDFKTLVLAPGRAFSIQNQRLGRGKGFYDQYFLFLSSNPEAKKNVHLTGVCFPFQVFQTIPSDEHDIKMDSLFY